MALAPSCPPATLGRGVFHAALLAMDVAAILFRRLHVACPIPPTPQSHANSKRTSHGSHGCRRQPDALRILFARQASSLPLKGASDSIPQPPPLVTAPAPLRVQLLLEDVAHAKAGSKQRKSCGNSGGQRPHYRTSISSPVPPNAH